MPVRDRQRFLAREAREACVLAVVAALCAACADEPERHSHVSGNDAAVVDSGAQDAGAQDARALDAAALADAGIEVGADGAALDSSDDAGPPGPEVGADYLSWPALDVPPGAELTLSFDVPSDARSFVLTLDPRATPRRVELQEVQGPGDALLFTAGAADGTNAIDPASTANIDDFQPYSLMLPSSPEAPLVPGHYRVRLGIGGADEPDADPVAADVVWQRGAQTEPHRLPLVLWFVAGTSFDAAAAEQDPQLQAALTLVREIYASAGIDVASIAYRDFDTGGAETFAVLDDSAKLAALFGALSEQRDADRALSIVFVEHLEVGAGKTVRGKTTGLPVPPPHPLLPRRGGIVVPFDSLPESSDRIAELLAHEIGHALGLSHTTEYSGQRHDPIADTPECPASRASLTTASGDAALSAEDCADLDGSNLLFYTPPQTEVAQRDLTDGQAFVLQHNPLVR